jgi:hypothetical protein
MKTMIRITENPILRAVKTAVGFPTYENLLCDGQAVKLNELKGELGSRLVIEDRKLCISHVRSLVASILDYKAVVLPLTVVRQGNCYVLADGFHRIAALDIIKENQPDTEIVTYVKLKKKQL